MTCMFHAGSEANTMCLSSVISFYLCKQIIPQSVCSRYGLAIGSTVAPFVRVLVWICFPVAFPISKVIYANHFNLFMLAISELLFDFLDFLCFMCISSY